MKKPGIMTITAEEVAVIKQKALKEVLALESMDIQPISNFLHSYHYEPDQALQILEKLGVLTSNGVPTQDAVKDGLFERAFVSYENILIDKTVLRYQSFVTIRGERFLDLLLTKANCPVEKEPIN